MTSVALVTCAKLPDLPPDDQLLLPPLQALGIAGIPVLWDDPGIDWGSFAAIVIRSTWDYHERLSAYEGWLTQVADYNLWNPYAVLKANVRKTYLQKLQAQGVPTVPTVTLLPGDRHTLADILSSYGWPEVVIKPVISAAGAQTHKLRRHEAAPYESTFATLIAQGGVLVQPFMPEIIAEGEWSLIWIGGHYSHALLKHPPADHFLVQEHFGGTWEAAQPSPSVISQAAAVLDTLREPLLYARVDGVLHQGRFHVMELELTEPSLFLQAHPPSAQHFAEAIAHVC